MHRWLILTVAAVPLVFAGLRPPAPTIVWWTTHALDKVKPYDAPPEKLKAPDRSAAGSPNSVCTSGAADASMMSTNNDVT